MKADVGNSNHVHLRIFKPLPMHPDPKPKLSNVQKDKKLEDSLDYF